LELVPAIPPLDVDALLKAATLAVFGVHGFCEGAEAVDAYGWRFTVSQGHSFFEDT
jgi:hypothetical protein